MLDELRNFYTVHTYVAVLKTANYRSMGLLAKLGFRPGAEEDAVLYEATSDETTLIKSAFPTRLRVSPNAA
jgi:RimJ/RimL family protein N-acetyltransferase